MHQVRPQLYLSAEHACSYLPGRGARNLVVEPERTDRRLYARLLEQGFRRSGNYLYRPHCAVCQACQSLRVSVNRFAPDRSQQRVWRRNQDLRLSQQSFRFTTPHYRLFARYLGLRHPDSGMNGMSPQAYMEFLGSTWCDTRLWEFHLADRLVCVAVVDHFPNALSAVYTFYDPDLSARGPGTHAILSQLHEARGQGLDWLYLGYQIDACSAMAYKARFKPHQRFHAGTGWWPEDRA